MALLFVLSPQTSFAQPYTDNFESYTVGGFLQFRIRHGGRPGQTCPVPGRMDKSLLILPVVLTKSVLCDLTPGASDLVWKLEIKLSGIWEVNFDYYIETGFSGYYNIQKTEMPGTQWAFELYFHTNGTATLCRKFNRDYFYLSEKHLVSGC